jgi:MFS family permease
MILFANDMRAVFWVAVIPAFLAVLCVLFWVEEQGAPERAARIPITLADLKELDRAFWLVVGVGVIFTLARFSEAFLILKATAEGLPLWLAPAVLVVMNIVYAAGAYPAGVLSDRLEARTLLIWGLACLILADLTFAFTTGLSGAFGGICLWGLHMALTQGLLAKMVADKAPPRLRGSAYGLFNLATGASLLAASVGAGLLWDVYGPDTTFIAGAGFAAAAAVMLLIWRGGASTGTPA